MITMEKIRIRTANTHAARKVILVMHISLDGFTMGLNRNMDWIRVDDEIIEAVIKFANTIDVALYVNGISKSLESYCPTVLINPTNEDLRLHHAQWLVNITNIILSRVQKKVEWNNIKLTDQNIEYEITDLKQQQGKNVMIFGNFLPAQNFLRLNAIDECLFFLHPVALGAGTSVFKTMNKNIDLKLLKTKNYSSGVVSFQYAIKHRTFF